MSGLTFLAVDNKDIDMVQNMRAAIESMNKLSHRGADAVQIQKIDDGVCMGCCSMGSSLGAFYQLGDISVVCNATIYNYRHLKNKYRLMGCRTNRCSELLFYLFLKFKNVRMFVDELDGPFSFVIYDKKNQAVHAARDMLGLRPLFWTGNGVKPIGFASEAKALLFPSPTRSGRCEQFPPGHTLTVCCKGGTDEGRGTVCRPFKLRDEVLGVNALFKAQHRPGQNKPTPNSFIYSGLRNLLQSAVRKRIGTGARIGCLLSGGLNSSLITALVVREMGSRGLPPSAVGTYTIGLRGSDDLKMARTVAKLLGTRHQEVVLTRSNFLNAVSQVIWQIESYDVETVRASVGIFLVSKYVSKTSKDQILFTGDIADALFASHLGFARAPDTRALQEENVKMVLNLHWFDSLRVDRCIGGAGLEARVPFADLAFVKYVMSLPPDVKRLDRQPNGRMGKHLLRAAFVQEGLLPASVLWRQKTACSDGISTAGAPWYTLVQEHAKSQRDRLSGVCRLGVQQAADWTDEQWWYKYLFSRHFGRRFQGIPTRWMQPFGTDAEDPSAKKLE